MRYYLSLKFLQSSLAYPSVASRKKLLENFEFYKTLNRVFKKYFFIILRQSNIEQRCLMIQILEKLYPKLNFYK